jgi:hypothetical protein
MSKSKKRDLPNTNEIEMYLHCGMCLRELPVGVSAQDWARLEVGWTKQGLQVWCVRHDANVMHVDFQGQRHPANLTMKVEPAAEAAIPIERKRAAKRKIN